MKSWKRLLFYLALNVVVSACTVLGVLFAWDQLSGPMPRDLLPKVLKSISPEATATQPAANASEPEILPTPTEEFLIYQVKEGDTFESIAEAYEIHVEDLIAVNGFTRSQPLGEGEVLRIPVRPRQRDD